MSCPASAREGLRPTHPPTSRSSAGRILRREILDFDGESPAGRASWPRQLGAGAPRWLAVRNVSDPENKAEGTLEEQAAVAAEIDKSFGRWSSGRSAVVCWALIAAE